MAVLALASTAFAIYQTYFYEKRGELAIFIESSTRVFDLHRPVGGLEISYEGENLRTAKKALWSVTLSISNIGNAEVRKTEFDEQAPFGIKVIGGELAGTPIVQSRNEYLSTHLKLNAAKDRITISPVIFEPSDSVRIEVLLLSSETVKPIITYTGKIVGSPSIKVVDQESLQAEKPFWQHVFDTNRASVYLARILAYVVIVVLSVVLLVSFVTLLFLPATLWNRYRRIKKNREALQRFAPPHMTPALAFVLRKFEQDGSSTLFSISSSIEQVKYRNALIDKLEGATRPIPANIYDKYAPIGYRKLLQQEKLLRFEGNRAFISSDLQDAVEEVARYVKVNMQEPYPYPRRRSDEDLERTVNALTQMFGHPQGHPPAAKMAQPPQPPNPN